MNIKLFLFTLFVLFLLPYQSFAACSFSVVSTTNTVGSSCSFDNTLDGIDMGTGTTNTSILKIAGGTVTIGANQQIAIGSMTLTGGSLAIIAGGKLLLNTPMWYTDPDNDGYYDSTLSLAKIQASFAVRKNSINPSAFDCNAGSSVVSIPHSQCYADLDGDTYTNGLQANTTCLNSASCATATQASASTNGAAVTAYTAGRLKDTANGTDCADLVAGANPGVTAYSASTFTDNSSATSYDWNCSGIADKDPTQPAYVCSVTGCAAHFFTINNGWAGAVPACGATATWNTYAGAVAGTCTTNIAGAGTTCPVVTTSSPAERCR